jgi:hypothetical protein
VGNFTKSKRLGAFDESPPVSVFWETTSTRQKIESTRLNLENLILARRATRGAIHQCLRIILNLDS